MSKIIGINEARETDGTCFFEKMIAEHGAKIVSRRDIEGARTRGAGASTVPVEEIVYTLAGENRYAYVAYLFDGIDAAGEKSVVASEPLTADEIFAALSDQGAAEEGDTPSQ